MSVDFLLVLVAGIVAGAGGGVIVGFAMTKEKAQQFPPPGMPPYPPQGPYRQ
ncbi:hypothetical protein [Saccharopolyspora hordei]|uniref:Uncharacterized protein n=1 Tax=Saccharopolyspora hordei TaxID=1838 RepID=A0A853AEK5_9PSEU|nr:hypothetical protein [Saccharopolyspora hordei]NYI82575.1 hypothetical protein [Saccharopolyspora hordei]